MSSDIEDYDDNELSTETIEIKTIPWLNWCRMCGTEECDGLFGGDDIIEEIQNLSSNSILSETLEYFFHIKVYEDDLMPQYLCKNCLFIVSNTIVFHEHVLAVQNMYSNLSNNPSLDIDLEEFRLESKVDSTEIEAIFSDFKKGFISFKHLLNNEEDANILAAKHVAYLESQADNITSNESCHKDPINDEKPADIITQRKSKRKLSPIGIRRSARNGLQIKSETNAVSDQEEQEEEELKDVSKAQQLAGNQEVGSKRMKLQKKLKSEKQKTIVSKNKLLATETPIPQNKKLLKEISLKPVMVLEDNSEQPLELTCKECNHLITSFQLYDEHMRKAHCNLLTENLHAKCLECEEDFENMNKLKNHFKDKHQPELPLYKCKDCTLCFRTLNALRLHARTEHDNMKPFMCKECGIMVSSEPILRKHMMLIHVDETPFECEHCKQKFKLKSALKTHIQDIHSGTKKMCNICGLGFTSSATLSNHYEVHSKKIIKCEICGLQLKHKRNHKRHMLTHTDLRLFACVICNKTFTCATSRRTHMKVKHPEELEAFDKAGGIPKQQLPSKEDLKEETNKWIARGALDSEIRHICHICGKLYKLEEALKTHILTHSTAKRMHKCEICEREFSNDRNLRRHFISHTNLKLFQCEFCEKKFSYASPCRTHMKEKHPNELQVFDELGLKIKINLPTLQQLRAENTITEDTKEWISE